jgi:hypothetical protein
VYAKIIDTVTGNSGPDVGLYNSGVVNSQDIAVVNIPYLYTIEVSAVNTSVSGGERARLQVLFLY